jgi:cysteinyl-tRNA synthetase, unknown class
MLDAGDMSRHVTGMKIVITVCMLVWAVLQAIAATPPALAQRSQVSPSATAAAERDRLARLRSVKNWGYQLKIFDLEPLVASPFDLIVVDHGFAATRDGKRTFDASDVERLKRKPDGSRRLVIAYLSIGEAEQYRFYWKPEWHEVATKPSWLGPVNKNWPGNFIVKFWDPDWQRQIFGPPDAYLERIMAQGFDGIYLDRADVYEEYKAERPTGDRDMITFIAKLAVQARTRDPKFLVILQNAEELLANASMRQTIDAVAKEDLLTGTDFSENLNPPGMVADSIRNLNLLKRTGRPVFVVEYLDDPAKVIAARQRLAKLGYMPYFGPRNLDSIIVDPLNRTGPFNRRPVPEQPQ